MYNIIVITVYILYITQILRICKKTFMDTLLPIRVGSYLELCSDESAFQILK